jgi:hypothetical protein
VARERSKSPIQLPNKNFRARVNQKGLVRDASSSSLSAHAESTVVLDEHSLRHSSIEVELGNVQEHPHEPATYRVDVLRFLNGFPSKNEIILLYATNNGTLLRNSVPIIPNKRYRIMSPSENIKNGDIVQVRLLIRFNATVSL